eukprot:CAMPEP_0202688084 /NCGR_PEP_ID=MMETSP1385-20130828/3624_1 /ASSEMBLY_ACC=CAM_ASM_000861 /TAXON_ID=933848 /ORGANISM="Elphidium margaritaceum" /LENGTH=401 /DNA_ID=CAMNT_0049342969 /DNA_START=42 /DNA_END=1247 /DNA_ORIENTATION=-
MGCCSGMPHAERQLSTMINKEITSDKRTDSRDKKILFLGSGGSGKSTLFKQLRYIHGEGFDTKYRENYIQNIHAQIVGQMKFVINIYIEYNQRQQQKQKKATESKTEEAGAEEEEEEDDRETKDELLIYDQITLQSPELSAVAEAKLVMDYEYDKHTKRLDDEMFAAIKTLWSEAVVKEIYELRNITKVETSSAYFWDRLDAIQAPDYLPEPQDILMCRVVTTNLSEQKFVMQEEVIHIIDIGGQRSQRRKWIHCFEYVVAVIFISSLSCYDEVLDENNNINSMTDQLELFEEIVNNPLLLQTSMILFLNKSDLFRQKFCEKRVPLQECERFAEFPENVWDYKQATDFITAEFERCDKRMKRIFIHVTMATDKNNIQKVFGDVQEMVIGDSLSRAGLIDEE